METVRVKATPETEVVGLAGLTGEIYGQSVPSIGSASPIIGPLTGDYAVNLLLADRNEATDSPSSCSNSLLPDTP